MTLARFVALAVGKPHLVAIDAQGRIVARNSGLGNEVIWEVLAARMR